MRIAHPFQSGWKASTTTSTESRSLNLIDDPVVALENNLLRLVPVTKLLCVLEIGRVATVEVLKDAVLILQVSIRPAGGAILNCGEAADGRPGDARCRSRRSSRGEHLIVELMWGGYESRSRACIGRVEVGSW